jgi:hypothetical protein
MPQVDIMLRRLPRVQPAVSSTGAVAPVPGWVGDPLAWNVWTFLPVDLPAAQPKEQNRMPAKSKKQQMAAGAALAAKRGDKPKSSLKGASRSMAGSMSEKELEKMAAVKRKSLPRQASK